MSHIGTMGDHSREIQNKTCQQSPIISSASTEDEFVENEKLFEAVMKNKWEEVVTTYVNCPRARVAKLTSKSEDTALHIAVSNNKKKSALQMVDTIDVDVLMTIKNAKGNTPLHLAAMLGNLTICEKMVEKNPKLLSVQNKHGETPIFLAVRHGQPDIFSFLHQNSVVKEEFLRRDNGDTILHVAVSGEYFSMATQIIKDHPNLVDAMNVDGLTPLHVLANKPNAFKSSTRLGTFDRFIYHCMFVHTEIKEQSLIDKSKIERYRKRWSGGGDDDNKGYPKNYETCMSFVKFLRDRKLLQATIGVDPLKITETNCMEIKKHDDLDDEENPQQKGSSQLSANSKDKNENNSGKKNCTQKSWLQQFCLEEVKMDENRKRLYPPNYDTLVLLTKFMVKLLLIILGVGIRRIREIERRKELHLRAKPVLELLIKHTKFYNYKSYGNTGSNISERDDTGAELVPESYSLKMLESGPEAPKAPDTDQKQAAEEKEKNRTQRGKEQTPILLAAKNGVTEMVEKILEEFPVAIQDEDAEQKNVALLAIENRQPHVYKFLVGKDNVPIEIFQHVDYQGNSALHLAATQCEEYRPWLIPGSALQMQWEIKWFKFVQNSMLPNFFQQYNKKKETPNEVFVNTHKDLIKDGSEWLTKTSESCSVVAALVAAVAFATSATVPGGLDEGKGTPTLQEKPAFNAFAISSLAALCFSVTALVFFLSILTSRYQEKDFALDLPRKLLLGLTSLFASIASMLVSFCAGHIFVLKGQLRYVAYPLYAALCLPITLFAFAQLSLYFDLFLSIFRRVPQRSYEVLAH